MIAHSLGAATANLLANQRPVLFLDTCDLVHLLQVVMTVPISELKAVNRLLAALGAKPGCCQPIGTYVTAVEFAQKTDSTNPVYVKDSQGIRMPPDEVRFRLREIDAQILKLHLVGKELGLFLPAPTIYANLGLLADLQTTAELLLDSCWELERDQTCVDAALTRVFSKIRPSQKREIKDSLHLEHCLELARRLRQNGFAEPIVFTSANKNDYGPAIAQQPHPDLQTDFGTVNMTYFESLSRGLMHIGI